MTIAYFDCFSGAAGDMILGALLDVGLQEQYLRKEFKKLDLSGYTIEIKKVERNHIQATDIMIAVTEEQHHRHLSDIVSLIDTSALPASVKKDSKNIFRTLARAEAAVHGISVEEVHFHEVGAVDSILDIVGSVIGVHALGITKIFCSPFPLGTGFVTCEHGILPLPAPATVELLKGVPVYSVNRTHELVTPTGAAIMTTLTGHFGDMPPMRIKKIGYGSGKIQSRHPALLRVYLGQQIKKQTASKKKEKK